MKNNFFLGIHAAIGVFLAAASFLYPHLLRELPLMHLTVPSVFAAPEPRVLFVGDIMLDRTVATHAARVGDEALFAGVQDMFSASGAVVANLEGTITDNQSVSQINSDILRFTFAPRMAQVLREAGVRAVSLANNHSLDFGAAGYSETLQNLKQAGIGYFGSPLNDRHISTTLTVQGKNICLIGFHQLFDPDTAAVIEEIKRVHEECYRTVVMAHWGEEYSHEPTAAQREAAHAFIDAGADVVVGAHPHVVEPMEVYKNRAIFYSLGNFIFDQGWMPQVRRGLAVEVTFGEGETVFTFRAVNTFKEASVAGATTTKAVLTDAGLDSPTFSLKN